MSDTNFKQGDSLWSLTRKLLERTNAGVPIDLTGVVLNDSLPDGADVAQGSKADAAATDSTSPWTAISILKGIWAKLAGTLTIGGTLTGITNPVTVAQATAANLKVSLVDTASNTNALLIGGNVGGFTKVLQIQPTITASAYSAGFTVGGIMTLTGAVRTSGGSGVLESLVIIDRGNQKAPFDIFIFSSNPAAATTTEHAAFVFSTDDLKVIAHISVATADYVTVNSKAIAHETSLGTAVVASGSANLYAVVVTSGTPTPASTTDLQFSFGFLQD